MLVSRGIDLTHYRANPIWLWQHNADWPVAPRSDQIDVQSDKLVARVQFPPAGVSSRADEVLGLIRAAVINAASAGFEKAQGEPIDPANPRVGTRIVACELAELSFVSIPAVPDTLVTERDAVPEIEEAERNERQAKVQALSLRDGTSARPRPGSACRRPTSAPDARLHNLPASPAKALCTRNSGLADAASAICRQQGADLATNSRWLTGPACTLACTP